MRFSKNIKKGGEKAGTDPCTDGERFRFVFAGNDL